MIELTVNPALFLFPLLCAVAWILTRSRTALNIAGMSMAAAVVLTVVSSNPVVVTNAVTQVWDQCQVQMKSGGKTCHLQIIPAASQRPVG